MPSHPTVYSGYIDKNAGFNSPEPVLGESGWTVSKSQQTGIYTVIHNLGLTNPQEQLHVVVQPLLSTQVIADIYRMDADSFGISTWTRDTHVETASDLMFIAAHYRK